MEDNSCLTAVRRIVEVHEKCEMPATFFIVARLLDQQGGEYRSLLGGHPLFEIGCHSYTHVLLRDHRLCGKACPPEQRRREVVESQARIADHFGQTIAGFRTPVGFSDGLRGAPWLVDLCCEAGYQYSSSLAWGPHETLPALVVESFNYAEQGHPELWEIPPCGWHENVLKGHNLSTTPRPLVLFPHPMPEAAAPRCVKTAEEEFAIHRLFFDKAVADRIGHVSLIWHPWSLYRFDPEMSMLGMAFNYVRSAGLPASTFADHVRTLRKE